MNLVALQHMGDRKLNILFLTYQGDMAGSTNSISFLAKGLAQRGHNVYLGIRKESLLWQLVEGTNVMRIPMTFKGKFDFDNWRQIRDAVKTYNIDVINNQSSHDRYTSIFSKWRYGFKAKIVQTRRQMPLSMGGPIQLYLYNKRTDGVVSVSHEVARALEKLGINKERIKVIHNGTPIEKYEHINHKKTEELRLKFNLSPGDFVIGCISRLKNQIQIIEALTKVKEPVKMIFCGIEATEEMSQIIDSYDTPHQLFFEGHVEVEDILSYYGLFNAKILASTMEGLSQSLLEAMALGVPVTATAFAGNIDLIQDRENGLLFDDGDIEQIATNIEELRFDQKLRETLVKNGKVTALQTFNIENTISNYEQYFLELIADL